MISGLEPTNVEAVMQRIRRMGAFKPWGSAVSAIEVALWDIAGKAAGLLITNYSGAKCATKSASTTAQYASPCAINHPKPMPKTCCRWPEAKEGFSIVKQAISFHSNMMYDVPNYFIGENAPPAAIPTGGLMTEQGMKHTIACIQAMKDALW
jgi:L-alanine-DL-glutamate epimerase-like enolase superfamily enzyme